MKQTHCHCGVPLKKPKEPVTVGGWYGDFLMGWDNERVTVRDARCARCRTRKKYTPVEVFDGVWCVAGLEGVYLFNGLDAAWAALAEYASGEGRPRENI